MAAGRLPQLLMDEFCATAHLYCSPEHLKRHINVEEVPGSSRTLHEAASLGRDLWADVAQFDLTTVSTVRT